MEQCERTRIFSLVLENRHQLVNVRGRVPAVQHSAAVWAHWTQVLDGIDVVFLVYVRQGREVMASVQLPRGEK